MLSGMEYVYAGHRKPCVLAPTQDNWKLSFVGNFDFQGLFPVLIIYPAIISFMVIKALSLWRCRRGDISGIKLVMAGSILFLISDIVLLFWLFGIGVAKEVQSVNWILYYMAQGCLSSALNTRWH